MTLGVSFEDFVTFDHSCLSMSYESIELTFYISGFLVALGYWLLKSRKKLGGLRNCWKPVGVLRMSWR